MLFRVYSPNDGEFCFFLCFLKTQKSLNLLLLEGTSYKSILTFISLMQSFMLSWIIGYIQTCGLDWADLMLQTKAQLFRDNWCLIPGILYLANEEWINFCITNIHGNHKAQSLVLVILDNRGTYLGLILCLQVYSFSETGQNYQSSLLKPQPSSQS